jgi:transcriptional regulator with XRE-family HTH domain
MDNPQNTGGRPKTRSGAIRNGIALWRSERALTQTALATACDVRQGHLSSWETGYAIPTWEELERLAKALGVTPSHLYSDDMVREIRTTARADVA